MSAPKPIGFDNWRAHFFISKDGSGNKFWIKASFCGELTDNQFHLFRGPSIVSIEEDLSDSTKAFITCAEAHGFYVGQLVRIYNIPSYGSGSFGPGEYEILTVEAIGGIDKGFTIDVDVSTYTIPTNIGIVGIDIGASIPVADYCMTPGRLCIEDYPDAWEVPFEG